MKAERIETVNDKKIEEFYWAGRLVCYVDNRLFKGSFEDAVRAALGEVSDADKMDEVKG